MKVRFRLLISRVNASQEVIRILYFEFLSVSVMSPEKRRQRSLQTILSFECSIRV